MKNVTSTPKTPSSPSGNSSSQKLVPIFIPKRFKGDDIRTVSVNGKYKHIPTGKQFLIEPCFAEAIKNASLAEERAEAYKASVVND